MGSGIYSVAGEVDQKNIDYWCAQCKYPTEGTRCTKKENIQECFDLPNANTWHRKHQCPFVHNGQECICNQVKHLDKIKERRE